MAPTDTEMLDWLAQDTGRKVEFLHGGWIAGFSSYFYVLGRGNTPRDAIREAMTNPRVDIKDLL